MSHLKILLFDGSFQTTAFINRLAKGLAVRHQVYILGFNETLDQAVPGVTYVALGSNQNKWRFLTTALNWGFKERRLFWTFKQLVNGNKKNIQERNVRAAIAYIQPDVVHLQWTSVINSFEFLLDSGIIPVILSQRGFHTNVKPFIYPENMEYLRQWYPRFAGFHSVSRAVAKNGKAIWHGPKKIDQVVYSGLSLVDWPFSHSYKKSEPIKIISVGRSHWVKGYDYALRCCHILKTQGLRFDYTIIGTEEEELQFLRHDLGLEKQVNFIKRVSVEKLKDYMQNASVMLLPSVVEGLPNVVIEALAIGLPVIAFDEGGVPELIEHRKTGWLVPNKDVERMADTVIRFAEMSLEQIEEVRKTGRKKVEKQHNEEMMVKGMEDLYYQVQDGFKEFGQTF